MFKFKSHDAQTRPAPSNLIHLPVNIFKITFPGCENALWTERWLVNTESLPLRINIPAARSLSVPTLVVMTVNTAC